MFNQYKFLFENTYETRWDFLHNTDKLSLSYYEDENVYYVGDEKTFNRKFTSFTAALEFFAFATYMKGE